MYAAAGMHKKATRPDTSGGSPNLDRGVRARTFCMNTSLLKIGSVRGVLMNHGATQFTLIPSAAHSTASDLVSCAMAAFAIAYGAPVGNARAPATEPKLTIAPCLLALR